MAIQEKTIYKKEQGIKYFSNKINIDDFGIWRLWESKTHPSFKHWSKLKNEGISK